MRYLITLLCLLAISVPTATARIWHVPGDAPTIQAGVDSADSGDIVEVVCGTYYDCTHEDPYGSYACVILKSGITLRSETGTADCVTIDAQQLGAVVFCEGVDNTSIVEGFTLVNGYTTHGGGMVCLQSELIVTHVTFQDNIAHGYASVGGLGGGMFCMDSAPSLSYCLFEGNEALLEESFGGGLLVWGGSPTINSCQFSDNVADSGGGISVLSGEVSVTDCTLAENMGRLSGGGVTIFAASEYLASFVAFNTDIRFNMADIASDGVVWGEPAVAILACCDVDLSNWLAEEDGTLTLDNEDCGTAAETNSWGSVKALYK